MDVIKRMIEQRDVWQSIQRQLEKKTHKNEDLLSSFADRNICKTHPCFFDNTCHRSAGKGWAEGAIAHPLTKQGGHCPP